MAEPREHTGEVDGDGQFFDWPQEKTLLDALLDADIPAPYSCMEGHCGTCQCTLEGGPSHMLHNEVLSEQEVVEHLQTLACQTIRDGDGPYYAWYY